MTLNDFSKKYVIKMAKDSKEIVVSPNSFNFCKTRRFPAHHSELIFWDGKNFYSGYSIYEIYEKNG